MELLMPVLLIFIIGGFFLYNPLRRKFKGIIGVGDPTCWPRGSWC